MGMPFGHCLVALTLGFSLENHTWKFARAGAVTLLSCAQYEINAREQMEGGTGTGSWNFGKE